LLISRQVVFTTAVFVWKCIQDVDPDYLQDLCVAVESVPARTTRLYSLRLTLSSLLSVVDIYH